MGYGGSLQDAGKAVGKAGDEGIDGIIKEDKLGLDTVYIQDARMATWLSSIGADDRVVTCTIARGEILFGLERLAPGRRRTKLDGKARQLFAAVPCEPIPPSAGDVYANTKVSQQRRGLSLDENDLRMAATALALSAILVSRDSDFHGIEGLSVVAP